MKKILILVIAAILIAGEGYLILKSAKKQDIQKEASRITNFDQCLAEGNPITNLERFFSNGEMYSEKQCKIRDGKSFIQNIGNSREMMASIVVDSPRVGATVASPLKITGKVRGGWFFEGWFPVKIVDSPADDASGTIASNEIGVGVAKAISGWATDSFVPFEATIEFSNPSNRQGYIILSKHNQTGAPENDIQLVVPVKF